MKKIMIYALAACATWLAGCSKDAGIDQQVAADGKYTLPAITASLDDVETRTGLGNNYIVNWSTNDRIAVINTKPGSVKIYQYVLVSGAGTSVGKFEPLNSSNIATFDDIKDIKAVYPAMAATVDETTGAISVSINKEYDETERAKYGVKSWTINSSEYAFGNNDIKVSYNTTMKTTEDANAQVNFKFRQLATWCNFVFNFKGTEYEPESMESLTITTADGTKMISGTAQVDLTDPNDPKLKEGTETAVEWTTAGLLSSADLTRSMMLFPCIDGDKLKITVKTNANTFTFYATPSSFKAGTVLRFPIDVNVNFEKDNAATADNFTYQVVPVETDPFYYYGTANCLLLADKTEDELDVTPYKTNAYYWNTEDAAPDAPKPTKAKVIWREAGITSMNEPTITEVDGKYTLNISGVQGYGNALVGIYESEATMNADTPLWSYHIWKPEIDPSDESELLEYGYTNSGTYYVMPIALGATNKATVAVNGTATNETNAKALGLYYQWGRKDPLGRPANISNIGFVSCTDANGTAINWTSANNIAEITSSDLLGTDNSITEKEGKAIDIWMLDYVTKHPTVFIIDRDSKYKNNWAGKDNPYLWGNPQGYNFPRNSTLHRSIFEPCPAGYRVAPNDLWIAFTKNGQTGIADSSNEDTWPENILNIMNVNTTTHVTNLNTQKGFFFCYEVNIDNTKKWRDGATDFYPASGYRSRSDSFLASVGGNGRYWSSSPQESESPFSGRLYFEATSIYPVNSDSRAHGFSVRCVKAE